MNLSDFLKKILNKNFLYDLLVALASFVLPFLVLIILFSINKFALTDHNGSTIIMFDMQSEYISFLRNLRYSLINHESLVYTTKRTFGGEYLSIFSFYLASPFNLLVPLIKENDLPLFFIWSNIIKMSLASFNMYLLLRLSTKERNLGYLAFSFAYGLISYSFAEMHNFMWLDCVMILPLVILGLKYLEEGKKHWVYAITLAYALGTSWYIGALICMFLVIFFIYRMVALEEKEKRIAYTIRFGVTSLAGGFISAALWFTAFMHLVGTKATGGIPSDMRFFSISLYFTGFLTNNFESASYLTLYSGWATMFTSVVTLALAQLFVLNKGYSKKDRLGALAIFVLYFFIVESNVLNAIFHGGQEPTWFPARYSFIIGFFVCYIAALEYRKLDETKMPHVALPAIVGIIVLFIVSLVPNDKLADKGGEYYKINILGVVIYATVLALVLLYLYLKQKKNMQSKWLYIGLSGLIVVLTGISSSDGGNRFLKTYNKSNNPQSYETYNRDCQYQEGVNLVKALETTDNYRMEITTNRPGAYNDIDNNPMFYNYNGLSHFSSNTKLVVSEYYEKLGYHNNHFFEKFDGGGTLSVSSLLGLKYLIDDNDYYGNNKPIYQKHAPFEQLTKLHSTEKNLSFYKNNFALPLGFAVNQMGSHYINEGVKEEGKQDIRWFNHFEYQNEIFKSFVSDVLDSSSNKKDIFEPLEIVSINVPDSLTFTTNEFGERYYSGTGVIVVNFKEPVNVENDNLYFMVRDNYDPQEISYIIDGMTYEVSSYWHKGIRGFERNISGNHSLRIYVKKEVKNIRIAPELYVEKVNVLGEYVNKIKSQSSSDLKAVKKTWSYGLEGTFELTKENQCFLFTLPFEQDFKVYVDGKQVKTLTRWNVFTAVNLDGYSLGNHKIKLVYSDKNFVFGIIISNIGIGSLVGIMLFEKKLSNKKRKDENQ